MKLVDSRTMRSIDSRAIRTYGIKGIVLMENAGRGVKAVMEEEYRDLLKGGRVTVVCGRGNNGGDGFVIARHLRNSGVRVSVLSLARIEDIKGDAGINARIWQRMEGETHFILSRADTSRYTSLLRHSAIVVDSLLGTGLSSEVHGLYGEVIDLINSTSRTVVSVDIPSGVDGSTGRILGRAIRADLTATMALPKIGLYLYPGREYAGRIRVVDIGMPRKLTGDEGIRWNLIDDACIRGIIRPRGYDTHKGSFGHLLVLAGSPGKTGAVCMTSMGAMRAGSGLVTVGLPRSINPIVETKTTEVMTFPLPETFEKTLGSVSLERIDELLEGKDAIVVGPGLGVSEEVREFLKGLLKRSTVPVVIDADGLNVVAGEVSLLKKVDSPLVLTPHPGEMARLLNTDTGKVQSERIPSASRLARITGGVVVLKGASTVVAMPDGRVFINPTGNPALATAGTGDVLCGMIGGFLAQGYSPEESAIMGVYIHGLAGDVLREEKGMVGVVATDLLDTIPVLISGFTG